MAHTNRSVDESSAIIDIKTVTGGKLNSVDHGSMRQFDPQKMTSHLPHLRVIPVGQSLDAKESHKGSMMTPSGAYSARSTNLRGDGDAFLFKNSRLKIGLDSESHASSRPMMSLKHELQQVR